MEKDNKYYGIIEGLIKAHRKYNSGYESIIDDIIDDVYKHAKVVVGSVKDEDVISSYLQKLVSVSIITVPKRMNFHNEIQHRVIAPAAEIVPPTPVAKIEQEEPLQEVVTKEDSDNIVQKANVELVDKMINSISQDDDNEQETLQNEDTETSDLQEQIEEPDTDFIVEDTSDEPVLEEVIPEDNSDDITENTEISDIDAANDLLADTDENMEVESISNEENVSDDELTEILTPDTDLPDAEQEESLDEEVVTNFEIFEDTEDAITPETNETDEENNSLISDFTETPLETEEENNSLTLTEEEEEEEEEDSLFELSDNDSQSNDTEELVAEEPAEEIQEIAQDNKTDSDLTDYGDTNILEMPEENDDIMNIDNVDSFEELESDNDLELTDDNGLTEDTIGDEIIELTAENDLTPVEDNMLEPFIDNDDLTVQEVDIISATDEEMSLEAEKENLDTDTTESEEKTFKPVNYSLFNFAQKENLTEENDIQNIESKLSNLNAQRPDLNIIKVFDLKYKQNLPIAKIAEELNTDIQKVVLALDEIVELI